LGTAFEVLVVVVSAGLIIWLLNITGLLGAVGDTVAVEVAVDVAVVTGDAMMGLMGVGRVAGAGAGAEAGAGLSNSSGSPWYSSPFKPLSIIASLVLCVRSTLGFLTPNMEFCCFGFTN